MASPGHLRFHKSRRTAIAVASGTAAVMLIWSPGAIAAAGCVTTGQTIECTSAGTETITVPDGAYAIDVVVIGGGGGGAGFSSPIGIAGAAGGTGAKVSGSFDVQGLSQLLVQVAAGGSGGETYTFGKGGDGGGLSAVFSGSTRTTDGVLVVAGGGGGGAAFDSNWVGGSGAAASTPAGGDGNGEVTTGADGADGTGNGGSAGSGPYGIGDDGADWSVGGNVDGSGGAGSSGYGGGGGDGYGGGGGGGREFLDEPGSGGAGGSFANSERVIGAATFEPANGAYGSGGQAAPTASDQFGSPGGIGYVSIRFYVRSAVAASSPTARTVNLDFSLPEGVACSFDSVEASLGSWIELPSASDCSITPRDGGEDPSLLGWATQEDFPVEIAQRQVVNGWGAYETFNDAGELTGVFIPAGGYTTVSNDTNLYPIWSE